MTMPDIVGRRVGNEQQPVAIVDDFHPDPETLRAFAIDAAFEPARNYYPGIRAALPGDYFKQVQPALIRVLRGVFGHARGIGLIDASFSIVTTSPEALAVPQRIPHVDALTPGWIALVHYLSPEGGDGTAFYRHRATGFETLDDSRSTAYRTALGAELAQADPPPGYIADDSPLFERTSIVEARFNRAVIYRSAMLHCGAIAPDARLDPSPASGRLTVTAFLTAS